MLDRSRAPRLSPARPFTFPDFGSYLLDNGLRVITAPDSRVPVTLIRLVVPAGAENDPAGTPGLAALTAALLDEGTSGRSSLELASAAERLGGYLSTSAGWSSARAETSLLSRDLELGLDLLADVVINPTFPRAEIKRLKLQTQTHLRRRRMQPAAAASDAFALALYRTGPYSQPPMGTEESIERIDRQQLREFHQARFSPGGATLIVCGAFSSAALEHTIEATLGSWQGQGASSPPPILPDPERASQPHIVLVDRPGAPQSEILVGHVGLRRSDPDFLVATVMNSLLGGKFTSRINLNLRERHGYTYGAHSAFAKRRGPGPFVVTAAVDNPAVAPAIREVLFELDRLRSESVPVDELAETIDYLIGSYPYSYETLAGVVNRLHDLAVHDLPSDYYSKLPATLAAISPEEIWHCARAHLHPQQALIVVVGPADELEEHLAGIADLERRQNTP
jgi:zinc protease